VATADSSLATLEYCDLWGNSAGEHLGNVEFGLGNLEVDPLFESLAGGNVHLQAASPCIDAGDPNPEFEDRDGSRNDIGVYGGPLAHAPSVTAVRWVAREGVPQRFRLYPNSPNPFNSMTTIRYDLPQRANVRVTVFDVAGREVRTLLDEIQEAGIWRLRFDADMLSSGIYFCRITAGSFRQTSKMLLLR